MVAVIEKLRKKLNLSLDVIIGILVFSECASRLEGFPSDGCLATVVNAIQLVLYVLLVIQVVLFRYSLNTIVIAVVSVMFFIMGWFATHNAVYIRNILLVLAVGTIPFGRTLKAMRYAMITTVVAGAVSVVLGLASIQQFRRGGISLGFVHPNQLSLIITIILLTWLAEHNKHFTLKKLAGVSLLALISYGITRSRTALLIIFAALVFSILQMHRHRYRLRYFAVVAAVVPMCCFVLSVLTAVFLFSSNLVNQLDLLFSNRIWLNWYAFSNHTVTLFGQNIDFTLGTGTVYNTLRGTGNNSITVDNSYVVSLLELGLIPTLIYLMWNSYSLVHLSNMGEYYLMSIGILLCIYAMFESQLLDAYFNFVLLATYSVGNTKRNSKSNGGNG